MKIKILMGLLITTIIVFTGLMFIKTEETTKAISVKKVYSLVHSHLGEEFTIPILINKENSPYITQDFIFSIQITNNNEDIIIPLEITEIRQDSYTINIDSVTYYQFYIDCYINIESNDFDFVVNDAVVRIKYNDSSTIDFAIGEFNYIYKDLSSNHLSLHNLSADYKVIEGINTLSGINIELFNKIDTSVIVKSIDIYSSSAITNNFYLRRIDDEFITFNEKLNVTTYNHLSDVNPYDQSITISTSSSVLLFIPINYIGDIKYLNQFGIVVTYEISGVTYKMVIDDFLFMSSSPFKEEVSEYFDVHEITD
ncbi:MAG: hypothetical protein QM489_03180 [Candidatus Izemoplasma sp.]